MIDWEKIIEIAVKTGDNVIFNHQGKSYVLLELGKYEKLLSGKSADIYKELTEEELIEKINSDIAFWRAEQMENSAYLSGKKPADLLRDNKDETTEEQYYLEPVD